MADILNRHQPAEVAAANFLKANPDTVAAWLQGVTTFDGRPALAALLGTNQLIAAFSLEHWLADHKIPVGDAMAVFIEYVKTHFRVLFDGISIVIRGRVDGLTALLRAVPSPLLMLGAAALSWFLRRSLAARGVRGAGAAVHHEPGLLGTDAGDALAGHRGGGGLNAHRRAPRYRRGPPAAAVCAPASGA